MKTCRTCGEEKELSEFYKDKKLHDGHSTQCKSCARKRKEEIKSDPILQLKRQIKSSIILENKILAKDKKKICWKCKDIFSFDELVGATCVKCGREYDEVYYEKNKEKVKEQKRARYEKNKEKAREYHREYREKNKEKVKEQKRARYEKNKEKVNEKQRERYEKNKEKAKEYQRERYEKNKEKEKERLRVYRAKIKQKKELENENN